VRRIKYCMQAVYIADDFPCLWLFCLSVCLSVCLSQLITNPEATALCGHVHSSAPLCPSERHVLLERVPTCCVTRTITPGDSNGLTAALVCAREGCGTPAGTPIDRCCHLSFNTVKWMTHCHGAMQRPTQRASCLRVFRPVMCLF
jgi:hypothetical protein